MENSPGLGQTGSHYFPSTIQHTSQGKLAQNFPSQSKPSTSVVGSSPFWVVNLFTQVQAMPSFEPKWRSLQPFYLKPFHPDTAAVREAGLWRNWLPCEFSSFPNLVPGAAFFSFLFLPFIFSFLFIFSFVLQKGLSVGLGSFSFCRIQQIEC